MKRRRKPLYIILLWLSGALLAAGQGLTPLAVDPAVKHSVFPDGLSCYIAENKSEKGFADFVLLRRNHADSAVVYSIEDKIVSKEETLDSTLIHMMNMVRAEGAPADQAIIISGDVNAASLMLKLKYMSLMIDGSQPSAYPKYKWSGETGVRQYSSTDSLSGLATIRFEWEAPRAPEEYLKTTQSAVYNKAAWELGDVACRWIRRSLRGLSIPVADVLYSCDCDVAGLSDEKYSLTVVVAEDDAATAAEAVESVLGMIDAGLTSEYDISMAHNAYLSELESRSNSAIRDNSYYVQMCRDAFLYNTPLTSETELLTYFRSKEVSPQVRGRMFAGIASALIDMAPATDTINDFPVNFMLSDTLALPAAGEKMKILSQKKAPLSGGVMWTFINGFKVIYKQMPTGHDLYYSMSLNGGYGNVPDLKKGEGRFMSDYAGLCWISGMKSECFSQLLDLSGMTMDTKVNMFNTVISGKAQDRNAHLMMKGLLAFANHRSSDTEEIEYYVKSRHLGRSDKMSELPDEETMQKAEAMFAGLTSKMNDGVLVIVGDMDQTELKKILQVYVGQFKVMSVATRRPSQSNPQTAGISTFYRDAEEDSIMMRISARMPMTAENHMAVELAMMLLERRLKEEFSAKNQDVTLSFTRDIYPQERFQVEVKLSGTSSDEDLMRMRECMRAYVGEPVDGELMKVCREYVKHKYALQMEQPQYWLKVIPLRHIEGKDFTTGYASKIDSVTSDKIKAVFQAIQDGAGYECITRNK